MRLAGASRSPAGRSPPRWIDSRPEAHPSDRRARIVRLTERGEEQAVKVFAGHKMAMDLAASGLSKTERAMLIRLLKKFGTSAGDSGAARQLEVSHVGTSDSATRP